MSNKDLVKLNGESYTNLPARREEENNLSSLHREMTQWMGQWDRMFSNVFGRAFGLTPWSQGQDDWALSLGSSLRNFTPAINVSENERELRITAELPGMDPKDVDLTVNRGTLTITGEKKEESESKEGGYHRMERSYGTFRRTLPLPDDVDADNISADFKNGVLTLVAPKLPGEKTGKKKIEIKSESSR